MSEDKDKPTRVVDRDEVVQSDYKVPFQVVRAIGAIVYTISSCIW
jgi:hypothetical protein